ncbi:MAG: PHP domain-containing protein [Simkaniaceae bacterium]|nr:PHP domain-containing protein [Candidatus Sacchlamyda saccharinae]
MMNFRADLHCHSTCSDGTMSPIELIALAKEVGLSGISITDHDTISAYAEAIPAAKEAGLALGPGVEFSSVDEGLSVHVLAYDFDLESPELLALCQRHVKRREDRNRRIIEKLKARGLPIEEEGIKGRPHIALALIKKGYASSVQDAFNRLIGDGKPCFDPGAPISTDETISVIHKAGGKAFIAHPHLLRNPKLGEKLLEKPFDGIECYYSKCPPNQEQRWVKVAQEKRLLMSGGSDFHGAIKPGIPLGCSWVDETTFMEIFQNNRCC